VQCYFLCMYEWQKCLIVLPPNQSFSVWFFQYLDLTWILHTSFQRVPWYPSFHNILIYSKEHNKTHWYFGNRCYFADWKSVFLFLLTKQLGSHCLFFVLSKWIFVNIKLQPARLHLRFSRFFRHFLLRLCFCSCFYCDSSQRWQSEKPHHVSSTVMATVNFLVFGGCKNQRPTIPSRLPLKTACDVMHI
jgi:hypothetical protein